MNLLSKIITLYYYILIYINKRITLIESITPYKIKVIVNNNYEYQSRFKKAYTAEPLLNEWANQIISCNDIVYDVGANIGNYSILFAKKIQHYDGSGHIYSFEPNYLNYKKLRENVSINNVESFITSLQIGLSNSNALLNYVEERHNTVGGSGKIIDRKGNYSVLVLKTDTIINLKNIQQPNHIKIDIDYYTNKLFENTDWLNLKSLKSVYIEIKASEEKYIFDKFYQNNFKLYKKYKENLSESNFLFTKQEKISTHKIKIFNIS